MMNFKNIWLNKREKLIHNPENSTVTVQADSELVEGFLSRVKTRNLKLRRNGISENRTIDFLRKKLLEKLLVRYLLPPQLQFYSFHSAV